VARLRASLEAGRSPVYLSAQLLCIEAGWQHEITHFRKTEYEYFSRGDWTLIRPLKALAKFDFSRI